ncbi:hypothetical protein [Kocuria marina]|uniref:hypothetical protein n=1 Tax=Kocuria marina TaxID=223184 RepID=UPI003F258259
MQTPDRVPLRIVAGAAVWTAGASGIALTKDATLLAVFHFLASASLFWALAQLQRQSKP